MTYLDFSGLSTKCDWQYTVKWLQNVCRCDVTVCAILQVPPIKCSKLIYVGTFLPLGIQRLMAGNVMWRPLTWNGAQYGGVYTLSRKISILEGTGAGKRLALWRQLFTEPLLHTGTHAILLCLRSLFLYSGVLGLERYSRPPSSFQAPIKVRDMILKFSSKNKLENLPTRYQYPQLHDMFVITKRKRSK